MTNENATGESSHNALEVATNDAIEVASTVTKKATEAAATLVGEASRIASETATAVGKTATAIGNKASRVASNTAILVGDLIGDGVVDGADIKIARNYAAGTLSSAADGLLAAGSVVSQEAGNLAKSVVCAPLAKDVATYAAVGAAIALPLPVVGSAIGAAVGAGLGLWRNMTRHETLVPESRMDPLVELERLHDLKEKGILTEEEFLAQKRKYLR